MPIPDKPSHISSSLSVGEYGATAVEANRDGSCLRLAFGRTGPGGNPEFYTAIMLSPEAIGQLKKIVESLD